MGLPSPETATGHRWQTIGQLVTFQQAAKTREGEGEKRGCGGGGGREEEASRAGQRKSRGGSVFDSVTFDGEMKIGILQHQL